MTLFSTSQRSSMALLLLLALFLAACGGGQEAPEATPTHTMEMEDTQEESEPESPSTGGNTVDISGFAFNPRSLTVSVGTTVTWTNNNGVSHTVTADDGTFDSGTLAESAQFSFTFDTPGTYPYYCEFHGGAGGTGMSAVITVEE